MTVVLVIATSCGIKQTRAAAKAAKVSADAAKQAANFDAELHRPYVGLTKHYGCSCVLRRSYPGHDQSENAATCGWTTQLNMTSVRFGPPLGDG